MRPDTPKADAAVSRVSLFFAIQFQMNSCDTLPACSTARARRLSAANSSSSSFAQITEAPCTGPPT